MFYLGLVIIGVGILATIASVLQINLWRVLWPLLLIGLGVYILLRPRMDDPGLPGEFAFVGEIRRKGFWTVEPQEIWAFVGDIAIDLTSATVPEGETLIKITGFVTEVKMTVPAKLGVAVETTAFVGDLDLFGFRQERIVVSMEERSSNYDQAARRVRIATTAFVADVKVHQEAA
jgi:hypothetical protein